MKRFITKSQVRNLLKKHGVDIAAIGTPLALGAAVAYKFVKDVRKQPPGTKKYYHRGTTWVYKRDPKNPRAKARVIGEPRQETKLEKYIQKKAGGALIKKTSWYKKRMVARQEKAAATRARNKAARGKRR